MDALGFLQFIYCLCCTPRSGLVLVSLSAELQGTLIAFAQPRCSRHALPHMLPDLFIIISSQSRVPSFQAATHTPARTLTPQAAPSDAGAAHAHWGDEEGLRHGEEQSWAALEAQAAAQRATRLPEAWEACPPAGVGLFQARCPFSLLPPLLHTSALSPCSLLTEVTPTKMACPSAQPEAALSFGPM